MFRSTAPTDFPQNANAQLLKLPIAHRKNDSDMIEVLPERTAPSQMMASNLEYGNRMISFCFALNPILCFLFQALGDGVILQTIIRRLSNLVVQQVDDDLRRLYVPFDRFLRQPDNHCHLVINVVRIHTFG